MLMTVNLLSAMWLGYEAGLSNGWQLDPAIDQ